MNLWAAFASPCLLQEDNIEGGLSISHQLIKYLPYLNSVLSNLAATWADFCKLLYVVFCELSSLPPYSKKLYLNPDHKQVFFNPDCWAS